MWKLLQRIVFYAIFCFVFVVAIPIGISILEVQLAIQRFPGWTITGAVALALCALLGLWFVVTAHEHPFRRKRVVTATIGQGAAMGLALGSLPVLIYVAAGGLLWLFLRKQLLR